MIILYDNLAIITYIIVIMIRMFFTNKIKWEQSN
jgi:hypothetical protein